jgi:hypothetical protein
MGEEGSIDENFATEVCMTIRVLLFITYGTEIIELHQPPDLFHARYMKGLIVEESKRKDFNAFLLSSELCQNTAISLGLGGLLIEAYGGGGGGYFQQQQKL